MSTRAQALLAQLLDELQAQRIEPADPLVTIGDAALVMGCSRKRTISRLKTAGVLRRDGSRWRVLRSDVVRVRDAYAKPVAQSGNERVISSIHLLAKRGA